MTVKTRNSNYCNIIGRIIKRAAHLELSGVAWDLLAHLARESWRAQLPLGLRTALCTGAEEAGIASAQDSAQVAVLGLGARLGAILVACGPFTTQAALRAKHRREGHSWTEGARRAFGAFGFWRLLVSARLAQESRGARLRDLSNCAVVPRKAVQGSVCETRTETSARTGSIFGIGA